MRVPGLLFRIVGNLKRNNTAPHFTLPTHRAAQPRPRFPERHQAINQIHRIPFSQDGIAQIRLPNEKLFQPPSQNQRTPPRIVRTHAHRAGVFCHGEVVTAIVAVITTKGVMTRRHFRGQMGVVLGLFQRLYQLRL